MKSSGPKKRRQHKGKSGVSRMQQIAPRYVPGDVLPTLADLVEWIDLDYPVFLQRQVVLEPRQVEGWSIGSLKTLVSEGALRQALIR